MFPELNNLLQIDGANPPSGKFILASNARSVDGGFLIHHFLTFYIKSGYNVALVTLEQSLGHYKNVAQRLGVNLTAAKEKGQFVCVEGLKVIGDMVDRTQFEQGDFDILFDRNASLKKLYQCLKIHVNSLQKNSPVPTVLLIDNISMLTYLGVSSKDITDFVHYLRVLMQDNMGEQGCLLTVVDKNVEDDELEHVRIALQHHCDIMLDVSDLASGYCKEVHGEVRRSECSLNSRYSLKDIYC